MATYLIVDNTLSYKCKSTHNSTPYVKVSNSYLDLTTETKTGKQLQVEHNGVTYIPIQTQTTTASRSSEYTETTGYTGVSSRSSTSGYTGVSSRKSTSGYTGVTQIYVSSGYVGNWKSSSSTYIYTTSSISKYTNRKNTSDVDRYSTTVTNYVQSYTNSGTGIWITNTKGNSKTITLLATGSSTTYLSWTGTTHWNGFSFSTSYTDKESRYGYQTQNFINVTTKPATGTIMEVYTVYKSSTQKSSSVQPGNMSSTTALTRASNYNSSSVAPGNMSSTTALTRSSAYNTSSVTTNAGISSTTALTTTSSRSSTYETITEL